MTRKIVYATEVFLISSGLNAVSGEEFFKFRKGTGASVTDVVIAEITEGNSSLSGSGNREERRGIDLVAENTIRLSGLQRRLPQILTVAVLQIAEFSNADIVGKENGILAVRTLQRIYKVDNLIGGHLGGGSSSHADLCAAGGCKKPLLTEDEVELLTVPSDLAEYKSAIMEALYKGTKRNIESETDPKNAQVG